MNRAVRIDPPAPDASSHLASWYLPGLSDGLGDRLLMFDNTTSASLELLRFRRDLTDWPAFEIAVRGRMRELERFQHPGIARVRAFKSLGDGEGLALVSNQTVGQRLSDLLHAARGPALGFDLIRQLTPILADLQGQGEDIAHGILTPERIIVTPKGRLVMVEHVLGAALQAVELPAHRLRTELGLAVRGHDGALGRRGDVLQLGLTALSLVLGRRIAPGDYPLKVAALLDELELIDAPGASDFARLRRWMQHALQIGGRAFASAAEAHEALREALGQRDDAPRENVIAFPTAIAEPIIEVGAAAPAPAAAPPVDDVDYDVGAMWRAAQTHVARARGFMPESADGPELDAGEVERGEVWIERRSSPYTAPLAALCVVQAVLITLLIAVPPAPEQVVITQALEVAASPPAPGAVAPDVPALPGGAAASPSPPPRTFTESFVDGVREAPAAFGRGVAAVWRGAADLAVDVFTRVRELVRQ